MTLTFRSFVVFATAQLAACASGDPRPDSEAPVLVKWAALSAGSLDATQSIQSDWKAGYCTDITLKNNGSSPVSGWTVVMNLHQSTVTSNYASKRDGSTFTPESYNAAIAPGGSLKFGFCASAGGTDYLATIASLSAVGGETGGGTSGSAGGAGASGSLGAAGAASAGAGAPGGAGSKAQGASASLAKTDEWNSGYCANVSVTGSSSWTVTLDMHNSAIESGQLWSGAYVVNGGRVTVTGSASQF